ncbi:hypothetical protein H1S01_05910 [Heliobacterium chlorum]|uniref:Uncharacterized protein n=1 Tax=Heliobacterium chlorum TaxID=2698 RepID=A0ABR7T1G9_HELCL|nr:hypothetical protein [Heliobacterium chlorum]MBC9784047.1 hypothetical protein [Heliobacterium chlorum]
MATETTLTAKANCRMICPCLESLCNSMEACGHCNPEQCVVGLIRKVTEQAVRTGRLKKAKIEFSSQNVSNGLRDKKQTIELLGITLSQCKNCGQDHQENCPINLTRIGLVYALTNHGDVFVYPGNSVQFILNLHKTDPATANELMHAYDKLRPAIEHL